MVEADHSLVVGVGMKTLLINPPGEYLIDQKVFPPLGLLTVAGIMQEIGQECDVLDMAGMGNAIIPGGYDFYGITCITPNMPRVKKISEQIRGMGGKVILGGPHITVTGTAKSERARKDWQAIEDISDIQVVGNGYFRT